MTPDSMLSDLGQVLIPVEHPLGSYYETKSIDCGCPEALFEHEGALFVVHFEENGEGEIFIDYGECGGEHTFEVMAETLPALVDAAIECHRQLTQRSAEDITE